MDIGPGLLSNGESLPGLDVSEFWMSNISLRRSELQLRTGNRCSSDRLTSVTAEALKSVMRNLSKDQDFPAHNSQDLDKKQKRIFLRR